MKILVGSLNPVKIEAVRKAFANYYHDNEVFGLDVASEVSVQPLNNEIKKGAINRVNGLIEYDCKNDLHANFFVGIESGLINIFDQWFNIDVAYIANSEGKSSVGLSSSFVLSANITEKLLSGVELGVIMDSITGQSNIKHKGGAISFFSQGLVCRQDHCEQAVMMAILTFIEQTK